MSTSALSKRSCDRCHAIKERCRRPRATESCERCFRLGHVCRNQRPAKKPGRRPQLQSPTPRSDSSSETMPLELDTWSEWQGFSSDESGLVRQMVLSEDCLASFTIGPSFADPQRRVIVSSCFTSAPIVKDSMVAVAASWLGDSRHIATTYCRASSAMSILRSLEIRDTNDVADCLVLGAMLLTFAFKLRPGDAFPIARRTLSLVKPRYDTLQQDDPERQVFLSCLVTTELLDCLLQCQVPTLRFRPISLPGHVDRFVGLCTHLLPLLYDLCEINQAFSHAEHDDMEGIYATLDHLERKFADWQPEMEPGFLTSFTGGEIAHMLCQVQVFRQMAFLIIHRMRYPFNVNDGPAQVMSRTILDNLQLTQAMTQKAVRCVGLAFVVACFELQGPAAREHWLPKCNTLVGYSVDHRKRLENIVKSLWAARDGGGCIYSFNLTQAIRPTS
ncbi:hypothetical protein FOBRF1_004739 [Fusarium oxysporum]